MNRPRLSNKQVYRVAATAFEAVIGPLGFTCAGSRRSVFHRRASDDIWQFICPSIGYRLPDYQVWVFPHSPRIEPQFAEKFPDNLPPPTDAWCNLHPKLGVGLACERYWCRTEEGFLRDFEHRVKPALLAYAVPYLDSVTTFEQLVPLIRSRYYLSRLASGET